ncbi:MAG: FeoB-associated Cys-rich membrane protein [Christensenellales bacterium]
MLGKILAYAALVVIVGGYAFLRIRAYKAGKSGCSGCEGCPAAGKCGSEKK